MAEPFDPYHVWLGIPPRERPVSHYRLLGIESFEGNPDVIDNAADQRMLLLRTFQVGKYSDLSQKLLNEVATAKVCLLRPEKKAAYDQQLRQQLQAKVEAASGPRAEIDSQLAHVLEQEARKGRGPARQAAKPGRGAVLVAAVAAGLLTLIIVVWAATRKAAPTAQPVAVAPERENRNGPVAATTTAPQPSPGATAGLSSSAAIGAPGATAGLSSSAAIGAPTGTGGVAEARVPNGPRAPPPAIAPFDAEKAKQHQQAWAKYLGIAVEQKNSIGMPLVLIPPGEFEMGATPEEVAWTSAEGMRYTDSRQYVGKLHTETPRHRVRMDRAFFVGMYPVTQGEYEKVMGANPSAFASKQMDLSAFVPPLSEENRHMRDSAGKQMAGVDTHKYPVETVNWDDATEFCRRLSALAAEDAVRRVYRLPTEAEWEYSCRAGTATRWYCGDDEAGFAECAWFRDNSGARTHAVGGKHPNAWGLYDLHGNVWQWCADWFGADYYKQSPTSDPTGPDTGSSRVMRGGLWNYHTCWCRCAFRLPSDPATRTYFRGFRVAVDLVAAGGQSVEPQARAADFDRQRPDTGDQAVAKPTSSVVGISADPAVPAPKSAILASPIYEVREAANQRVQERYGNDLASAKSPAARQALAKRILDVAEKAQDKPAERYALCCLARDVAVAAQDEKLALEAIDALGRTFDVDAWAMKAETMEHLAKGTHSTAARWQLAERAVALAEEAFKADKLSAAGALAKLALAEAGKLRDRELVGRSRAVAKEIQEAEKAFSAAEAARAQLKQHPGDAAANSALGRYLSLVKGDWEAGLPHLAEGDDPAVKALAADDLKQTPPAWKPVAGAGPPAPVPATAAMKLAGAWWDMAEKAHGRERDCMLLRAGYWYEAVSAGPEAGEYSKEIELRSRTLAKQGIKIPPAHVLTNCIGMPLVLIPSGEFEMGSTPEEIASALAEGKEPNESEGYFDRLRSEEPRHRVKISKPFYMGVYAVTQGEYERVMGLNPSLFAAKQMDASAFKPPLSDWERRSRGSDGKRAAGKDTRQFPVETVDWEEATEFCNRLAAMPAERAARRRYRLPSEAEWEYACRAGTTTRWYSGDRESDVRDVGWVKENSRDISHPVGEKTPNAWGLYDMHGNVWQWCADWFSPTYYKKSLVSDPAGPPTGARRVLRGGSWYRVWYLSGSAYRHGAEIGTRYRDMGFRVVAEH